MSPDFATAKWRKSVFSDSGDCVEVAMVDGIIGVRDSKDNAAGPMLRFTRSEWDAFLRGADNGEFTLERLAD